MTASSGPLSAPSALLQPTIGRLRLNRNSAQHCIRSGALASAVVLGAAVALPAAAQQQTGAPAQLPTISVQGQQETEESYKVDQSASQKLTAPLLDTPRSVTIINQAVIEERGMTSLQDVFRTTPGISLGAGEGGNPIGDRPFIRGFDALTSMYIDGIRDTGAQSREIFNLEQVEITKGPNSTYGGRGTTGGSVNLVSKTAKARDFNEGSVTLGTDMTKRATVDINRVIDGDIGIRINAMAHDADVAGRNEVEVQRFGFAPSVTFGLNKPTSFTLSYYHLQTDDIPDYGHPFDPRTGQPVSVDRDTFYGLTSRDYRHTYYDGVTGEFKHDLSDSATLRNMTRYSYSENEYVVTKPNASLAQVLAGQMNRESRGRNADSELLANLTDVTGDFDLGGFGNSYNAGIELSREKSKNRGFTLTPATLNNVSLYAPDPSDPYNGTINPSASFTHTTTRTAAVYALNTTHLTPQWDVNLGLRFDNYSVRSESATATLKNDSNFLNYQAGLVYKPAENGSIYISYATSSNPAGGGGGEGGNDGNISAAIEGLEPEENVSYELGTKWDVLEKKLSLTAAVFRTEKTNARVTVAGGVTENAGEQRVDGFEIGFSGNITPEWKVFGGYTFLKSEIVDDGPNANNDGKEFPLIAPNSLSLWTSYDITQDITVGAGATYQSARFVNSANTYKLGSTWRFDAMAGYKLTKNVDLQLNVLNISDETIYDASHNGQFATVAPGRTALLTTNFKF